MKVINENYDEGELGQPGSGNNNNNNQPNGADGSDAAAARLTENERAALEGAGASIFEIDKLEAQFRAGVRRKPRGGLDLANVFRREAKLLLESEFKGKPLVSSKLFGTALIKRGVYHSVRGFNAVGDHLGKRGLRLPTVIFKGVRRSDISFADADDGAKREREEQLRAMRSEVLELLVAESVG